VKGIGLYPRVRIDTAGTAVVSQGGAVGDGPRPARLDRDHSGYVAAASKVPEGDMDERTLSRPGMADPAEDPSSDALRGRVTIAVRPIGAPTPIGLFGLAAAAFVLSGLQLGWVDVADGPTVALVLMAFAFGSQGLAAVFALLGRDGTVGTAMSVLALTWLLIGLTMRTSPPGATSRALGLFLLIAGVTMILTGLTATLSKLVPAVVFLVAAVRFLVMAGYELSGDSGWARTAGWMGLVLCLLALYAAWAAGLEDAAGRTVLPFGRRGKGELAVHGSLPQQLGEIATEPGVRTEL
jgi:succinate-acetate transporter protein